MFLVAVVGVWRAMAVHPSRRGSGWQVGRDRVGPAAGQQNRDLAVARGHAVALQHAEKRPGLFVCLGRAVLGVDLLKFWTVRSRVYRSRFVQREAYFAVVL